MTPRSFNLRHSWNSASFHSHSRIPSAPSRPWNFKDSENWLCNKVNANNSITMVAMMYSLFEINVFLKYFLDDNSRYKSLKITLFYWRHLFFSAWLPIISFFDGRKMTIEKEISPSQAYLGGRCPLHGSWSPVEMKPPQLYFFSMQS